jgi:hypothetical protein
VIGPIDWTISAEGIAVVAAILGSAKWIVSSLDRLRQKLDVFSIEHEFLIADWCKRTGTDPKDLPTRTKL